MARVARRKGPSWALSCWPGCFDLRKPGKWRVTLVSVSHPKYGRVRSSQGPGARIPRLVSIGCSRGFPLPGFPSISWRQMGNRTRGPSPSSSAAMRLEDDLRASVPESWARAALWPFVWLHALMCTRASFAGSYSVTVPVPGHMLANWVCSWGLQQGRVGLISESVAPYRTGQAGSGLDVGFCRLRMLRATFCARIFEGRTCLRRNKTLKTV